MQAFYTRLFWYTGYTYTVWLVCMYCVGMEWMNECVVFVSHKTFVLYQPCYPPMVPSIGWHWWVYLNKLKLKRFQPLHWSKPEHVGLCKILVWLSSFFSKNFIYHEVTMFAYHHIILPSVLIYWQILSSYDTFKTWGNQESFTKTLKSGSCKVGGKYWLLDLECLEWPWSLHLIR